MSDHIGLRYLFDHPNLNTKQARWLAMISEFDFQIRYIKSKQNRVGYALNRWVDVNHLATISSYGTDLQDRILRTSQQDVRYMEIMHKLQHSTSTGTGDGIGTCDSTSTSTCTSHGIGIGTSASAQDVDYFLTTNGLVRFGDRIYVSESSELKKVILREFHANPYSGHPSYQKTLIKVKRFYYWSNLKRDVAKFVARCFYYQHVKVECKHPSGLLQPITIPKWKREVISTDFITGLPKTVRHHDSITVVVDRLKKVAPFILVKSTLLASDVAQVFIRDVVRLHGIPKKIVLDRDEKLTYKFWKELFAGLGIELAFSTTYHPQTDRQKKSVNRILEDMLRMYVMHQKWKWEEYLLQCCFNQS